ncbi:MAG: NAD(P)/FAD-dependent oxidoreductase [Aigarchaeota archaeon]|nr:NAD(P)/FAD-dependent oxidoreductase [Aigarchaeota archaeon]
MFKLEARYDVIVIGAGPAGLMAARKTAEGGANTLLLEKERSLGVKPCGEAVSLSTLADAGLSTTGRHTVHKVRGAHVIAPDGVGKVTLDTTQFSGAGRGGGMIIDKPVFLEELAAKAVASGAQLAISARVEDVERSEEDVAVNYSVMGRKTVSRAKVVIGCDGVGSLVAKKYFNRQGYELVSCLQYLMTNCNIPDEDMLCFYFGSQVAPRAYVWVFPKGEGYANVGLGVRGAQAKPYLDKFIHGHSEMFESSTVIGIGAATLPVGGVVLTTAADRLMLAGDAAGQVIPVTGGGIHTSIMGGALAGEVATESLEAGDQSSRFLKAYEERYRDPWGQRIERSLKVLRVLEKLGDDDLNELASVLTGDDIMDLANGLNITRVAAKLFRHPIFALKVAKALA